MMATDTSSTTEVGSYFISNYPPFSQWTGEAVAEIEGALDVVGPDPVPLGLYLHIPFCRKRCKFCYFRVYTNQNAQAIANYVEAMAAEAKMVSRRPGVAGRKLEFVYFGGGTPSYLSSRQLRFLRDSVAESFSWETAKEVTFECEPGHPDLPYGLKLPVPGCQGH